MLRVGLMILQLHIIRGYDNLALNSPTFQTNTYISNTFEEATFDSSNAVDGLKDNRNALGGQCAISADGYLSATWWVNLTSIHSIHDVRIFYRTDNGIWDASNGYTARFLGFYVYVSNTTNLSDGHLCLHDTNHSRATIPAVVDINCFVHGQYVIYHNERPQHTLYSNEYSNYSHAELCEVEVNGCKRTGVYGPDCSRPCPHSNCRYCHIETGACQGCKPGYKGHQCELPCSNFRYGELCLMKCGNCSEEITCNHVNGVCPDGCDFGVTGNKCNTPCAPGWYGKDCSEICGNCDTCDRFTGHCTSDCKTGWKGNFCKEECGNGTYGNHCMEKCGTCLRYKQCHHINGSCHEGCDAGYLGELCKTRCSLGKFGMNCLEDCSEKCGLPTRCNGTTGECDGGCQPGWKGHTCRDECTKGMFGENCSQPCGYCQVGAKCHHINGTCSNGCMPGYKGMLCFTVCSPGTYGLDCLKNCSSLCLNNTCNPSDGICREMKKTSPEKSVSDNIGAIVGGSSGVAIACVVIVIAVLTFKRRRSLQKNNGSYEDTEKPKHSKIEVLETNFSSIDSKPAPALAQKSRRIKTQRQNSHNTQKKGVEADEDTDEQIHSENPYGDFYANEKAIRDVPLDQLVAYIAEKRKNKDDGFQREYATLPYGEKYKCDAGKKEENMVKNRYRTTFPYDHTRVILHNESGSDYINANFIEGAEHEKQYVAAQGPKKNTVTDFWTMVWQEQVTTIVMLTNLREGNKTKCTKYWPDPNQHISYGIVSVKTIEEKEYAFYDVRKLNVTHGKTKKSRTVTQYHYTAWPDHGTPEPLSLVIFLYHVRKVGTNQRDSPTVVHCSAGIGRTGTYIAIDVLNEIGRKTGTVNVAEYVKKMRENRMNMVQTYEQYMTIFLALSEIYKSPVSFNTIGEFTTNSKNMTIDKPANQSSLREEFQLLMIIRPVYNDNDFKLAREGCGDMYSNGILPLDKYSVHLSSNVPKRGNFINAITVPSYKNKRAFIVTKYPTEEDAVDFLRLLNDHECDTVICMDPINKIDSSEAWLPSSSSSKTVPPFTIHVQSQSANHIISTTVHILEKNNEEEAHPVTIIEPKVRIETSGTFLDTSPLRSLVSTTLAIETENPITIVSSDGAALSGVFCAVHNVIQQINMDACVDVFTAVRQLQVRRPEFCSNLDEYGLVINAVYDHIQGSDTSIYYNQ